MSIPCACQERSTRSATRTLRVAYTPDSDDAFNFYAWEHGLIPSPVDAPMFHRAHISELNVAAQREEYDVVAISAVAFPAVATRYRILSSGTSVGRGYGPVLVSRAGRSCADLAGRRVGIAGDLTTGGVLAAMYVPGARLIPMAYDAIADAICRGELDAGVMIHEELLHYPARGLHCVRDLGEAWREETGLPLTVGLNLVHRRLGLEQARQIARACRDSLLYAQEHMDEALSFAGRFGRGCARQFIAMFSNADTLCMPGDARRSLRLMCERLTALGLAPKTDSFEIVDV